jgi:DNA polymerase-3 subunit delta
MAKVTTEDLLARLEKGSALPAILLLGAEPYLRDACRAQLIASYVPEASRTWAVSRYSADRGETQAALGQAQTMPMLSPKQVVFLEDAEMIEKLAEAKREAAVAQLEAYFKDPAPFSVLVLEAAALDQRMKLAKLLAEKTLVVEVGLGDNPAQRLATAADLAHSMAKAEAVTFEPGAAEDLAELVSADLQRLKTEISKLATYVGARKKIRREDVALMVISEKTTTVWDLAGMLADRQSATALDFLDRLLGDGEAPLLILGGITWMYRKIIEASEIRGASNGWQAARTLGMRPEQAEQALQAARKIPKSKLLAGLSALQYADDRLKRGSEDARAVMEFLLVDLTSSPAAKAAAR